MTRDEAIEAEIEARIAREMEICPPLTERQKTLIAATFAELRTRQAGRAAA